MFERIIQTASRLRPDWRVVGILILGAVFLAPATRTGYWAEDLYQSIMPRGFAVIDGKSVVGVALEHVQHTIKNGRFFPLTPMLITTVHYFVREAWVYKTYIVATSVLDLLLFYCLVRDLTGRRDFAGFATCLTVGLIQYRVAIDPSLGFFGQMQLLIAGLFLSLLALRRHLEGQCRRWLVAAVGLYLCCCLMYEVSYTLVFLYVCLILQAVDTWRRRLWTSLPFFMAAGSCALGTIVVRKLYPSDAYWNHADGNPGAVFMALFYQVTASLPLSYFVNDPLKIFPGPGLGGLARWIFSGGAIALGGSAVGLSLLCLRSPRATPETPSSPGVGSWCLAGLGLILAIFPAILISISPYHRASIKPGVGWIPLLIQDYGVGLLLAAALWKFVEATVLGGSNALSKRLVVALLVGVVVSVTYRANQDVVRCFNAVPGSRLFRGVVGNAGGAWHEQRKLLESALGAGLLAEIPEKSTVVIAREYPYWYDSTYSRFFYAAHSGKSLVTLPPGASPAPGEAYRVRDVLLGRESGYVVLSRNVPAASASSQSRIFVRHRDLSRQADPFRIKSQGTAGSADDPLVSWEQLRVIKSGRDWAIYALEAPGKSLAPDSIQVVFNRPR